MKRILAVLVAAAGFGGPHGSRPAAVDGLPALPVRVIVGAHDADAAAAAVRRVGGSVSGRLGIIDAASATVTRAQLAALLRQRGLRVWPDHAVRTAEAEGEALKPAPDAHFPRLVGADLLHGEGVRGAGVTVAVLDSGLWPRTYLEQTRAGENRVVGRFDAYSVPAVSTDDGNGHGTFVTSVIASSRVSVTGRFLSVAPDARLVVVKAFASDGSGTYSSVIRGLDWIVQNRGLHGTRVVNLAFTAPARSHYWDDPLARAVMKTWQAGIVVVASAGNGGPQAQSIGVPGNVPYVITVGAMTDSATPDDPADDRLSAYSAAGPTWDGFVKPDLVAPGGHVLGTMGTTQAISVAHPEARSEGDLFTLSGTSPASAVVTGVVALLLQVKPQLTPDQVKCRLMTTSQPAVDGDLRAYSIFQQGAGLVSATSVMTSNANGCANAGLDIAADLAGTSHYAGRARQDPATGAFYLSGTDGDGYSWNGGVETIAGFPWNGYPWNDSPVWSEGFPWAVSPPEWANGYPWPDSPVWTEGLSEPVSVNAWVPQE